MMEYLKVQSMTMDSLWKNSLSDPLEQNSLTIAQLPSSTIMPMKRHRLA